MHLSTYVKNPVTKREGNLGEGHCSPYLCLCVRLWAPYFPEDKIHLWFWNEEGRGDIEIESESSLTSMNSLYSVSVWRVGWRPATTMTKSTCHGNDWSWVRFLRRGKLALGPNIDCGLVLGEEERDKLWEYRVTGSSGMFVIQVISSDVCIILGPVLSLFPIDLWKRCIGIQSGEVFLRISLTIQTFKIRICVTKCYPAPFNYIKPALINADYSRKLFVSLDYNNPQWPSPPDRGQHPRWKTEKNFSTKSPPWGDCRKTKS